MIEISFFLSFKKGKCIFGGYNIYRKITRKDDMEKLKYRVEKYKKIIIIVLVILFILIGLIVNLFNIDEEKLEDTLDIENIEENDLDKNPEEKKVKVDIKGFIKNPGVYELSSESRILDVIEKAGGLLENANTEHLNLSRKVLDEMVIIIYSNDEVNQLKSTDKENIKLDNDAYIDKTNVVNNTSSNNTTKTNNTSKNETPSIVSLNTGTKDELMTLKGIGESKAKLIIEYRENNGGFKSIEEIKNIKGIGDSIYSKIKEYIKL